MGTVNILCKFDALPLKTNVMNEKKLFGITHYTISGNYKQMNIQSHLAHFVILDIPTLQ